MKEVIFSRLWDNSGRPMKLESGPPLDPTANVCTSENPTNGGPDQPKTCKRNVPIPPDYRIRVASPPTAFATDPKLPEPDNLGGKHPIPNSDTNSDPFKKRPTRHLTLPSPSRPTLLT